MSEDADAKIGSPTIQTEEISDAMARLIYSAITSLDGYVEDKGGNFDWSAPDEEVLAFVNDLERPIGTYLYGRRMYETMVGWEKEYLRERQPLLSDFARIWRSANKIVFSRSLDGASSAKTWIKPDFDPDMIRQMKASTRDDLTVGGAELAAQAFRAGLVGEFHLFLNPIIVGGGKPALPSKVRTRLELLEDRRFGHGVAYLHCRVPT